MTHTPTTGAVVVCMSPRFEDETGAEDPDKITLDLEISFNGLTGVVGDRVTFARSASMTAKQAAVRTKLNELLVPAEPGVSLTNATIQIIGLPV